MKISAKEKLNNIHIDVLSAFDETFIMGLQVNECDARNLKSQQCS